MELFTQFCRSACWILIVAFWISVTGTITEEFLQRPRVILHQWGNQRARPTLIRNQIRYLETNRSLYDGAVLFLDQGANPSFKVMTNNTLTYEQCYSALQPIVGLNSTTMKYFFAAVYTKRPADLFDNWDQCIRNWANLARAVKNAGCVGIMFDNEEYFADSKWQNYPDDCAYKEKSLAEYVAQARLRGKQVMEACVREFPQIIVFTLHGPYVSCPKGPPEVYNIPAAYRELAGAFFVGMMEGRGEHALVTDGGEMYALRTQAHFASAYKWQKYDLGSTSTDCFFIPASMRDEQWTSNISISYGLYDRTDPLTNRTMDPDIAKTTTYNALMRCDHFIWWYYEGRDMISNISDNDQWAQKALEGKQEALEKRGAIVSSLRSDMKPSVIDTRDAVEIVTLDGRIVVRGRGDATIAGPHRVALGGVYLVRIVDENSGRLLSARKVIEAR